MIEAHRGAGMLAPGFGILSALVMNVISFKLFGVSHYDEHKWPKLSVLLVAGLACLIAGLLIKRKRRKRDAHIEEAYINSLSPKFETAKQMALAGPRDHLMFIPLQYWSLVYFAAAIVYALKS